MSEDKDTKAFLKSHNEDDKEYGIISLAIKYNQMEVFLKHLKTIGIEVKVSEDTKVFMEFYSDKGAGKDH